MALPLDNSQLPDGFTIDSTPQAAPAPKPAASNPALPDGFTIDSAQPTGPRQLPPMSKAQADAYLQTLATHGQGTYQPPKSPSFASTALVDPNSPVFGEQIKSSVHPDSRGGRNLVPIQDVAAVRQQMQQDSANPDQAAAIQRSQQMDTTLPLAERLRNRAGLESRKRAEFGQAVSNVNDQWKQFAGSKGADAGGALAQFMARSFQTENPTATPGEIGAARSIGKNVVSTAVDPVTHATILTGGVGGKLAQTTVAALFSAGAAKQSYDAAGQLGSIWDRQDIPDSQKAEMASDLLLNTAMAGMAGAHAMKVPFMKGTEPFLSAIPEEGRAAVAQKFNSAISKTGGVLLKGISGAGDVMADVANSDRENVDAATATDPRQVVKQRIVDAAPKIGVQLNSADNTLQAIKQARADTLAHHEHLAGGNLGDIAPGQADSMNTELDLLNTMEDHIQAGRDKALLNAEKPEQPTRGAAAMSFLKGAGIAALGHGAATAAESMGIPGAHLLLEVAGLSRGGPQMVSGIKGILAKRLITPDLHDAMVKQAFSGTQPTSMLPDGFVADAPNGPDPFAAQPATATDASVQHTSNIAPPDRTGGNAQLFPDVPSRMMPFASSSTAAIPPELMQVLQRGRQAGRAATSTAFPQSVTPQLKPRQIPLTTSAPASSLADSVTAARQPAPAPTPAPSGDIFPNDTALENWLRQQEQNNPVLQRIREKVQRNTDLGGMADPFSGANTQPARMSNVTTRGQVSQPAAGTGSSIVPDRGFVFTRPLEGDSAIQEFLVSRPLGKLKGLAQARGIPFDGAMDNRSLTADLITKLTSSATPEELAQAADHALQSSRSGIQRPGQAATMQDAATQATQQPPLSGIRNTLSRLGDRRKNLDFRAQFDAMPPEKQVATAFMSDKTGLHNYRAFEASGKMGDALPHVGFADIDDFKNINSAIGSEKAVDEQVLPAVGAAFRDAAANEPNVHVFHRSGDEFLLRSDDPAAISRVVNGVNETMKSKSFQGANGEVSGIGLSHGVGSDEVTAKAAEAQDKQTRLEMGLRKGTRDKGPTVMFPVKDISVRPDVMQFRTDSDPVTGEQAGRNMSGVKFDQELAGPVRLWKDPQTGEVLLGDGHHRLALAKRSGVENVEARFMDVPTVEAARARAAFSNIAEGNASLFDAAKFLRDSGITPEQLAAKNISLNSGIAQKALSLSKLDASLFDRVRTGQISENHGAIIGDASSDPAIQDSIVKEMQSREARGRSVTDANVAELARLSKLAGTSTETTMDLFGGHQETTGLLGEFADASAQVRKDLASRKSTFGAVAKEGRAKTLNSVEGQSIVPGENAKISQEAAQLGEIFDKVSTSPGTINNLLMNAARKMATMAPREARLMREANSQVVIDELRKMIPGGNEPPPAGGQNAATK